MRAIACRCLDFSVRRRRISFSTASRMKSDRFSLPSRTDSMRANVPSGNLAGYCSSLILIRPTGRFVPDGEMCVNAASKSISPIDIEKDTFYKFRGYLIGAQA